MSFADKLREARSTPVATFHEFKLDYARGSGRVYAFFEAHEDQSFYVTFLQLMLGDSKLIRSYKCGSKRRVFEALKWVSEKQPDAERTLFFVDKDHSDLLGETWPSDSRVYTTEWYSIESYLVCEHVVERYAKEAIRMDRVSFDFSVAVAKFNAELQKFHRHLTVFVAWSLAARRAGHSPNLANVRPDLLVRFDDDLCVCPNRRTQRLREIVRLTGLQPGDVTIRQVRVELAHLNNREPKTFISGKHEVWFLNRFLQLMERKLRELATEVGGSVSIRTPLTSSNTVEVLAPRAIPSLGLTSFLNDHLAASAA